MSPRSSSWIRRLLAGWVTYLLIFTWLPLVRVIMDGESYRWATVHFGRVFSAEGWEVDAWILVLKAVALVTLLWGLRRSDHPAFRWATAGWLTLFALDLGGRIMANPDGFVFRGDTLGLVLNIGWPAAILSTGFAVLALYWAVRPPTPDGWVPPAWTPSTRRRLIWVAALLPVLLPLLALGEPHGRSDQVGVLLTIAMAPLLAWALGRDRAADAQQGAGSGEQAV